MAATAPALKLEQIALSGDGRFLAEVKNDKGQRTLWVRNTVTNTDTQILEAFANHYVGLTFSPDGNYLYFTRSTPHDDQLSALYVMPVFGGTPKQLIVDIDTAVSFSPDGNRFAYVKWSPERKDQYSEVHIADKDGSDNHVVYSTLEALDPPVWSPDGSQLAWLSSVKSTRADALQFFKLSSKKVRTAQVPADVVFQGGGSNYTNLVWTPDGRHLLALHIKPHSSRVQIGIVTVPSGEFHAVTNDVNSYAQLALSADGHTLATVLTNMDAGLHWYKGDGGASISDTPLRSTPEEIAWASEDRLVFNVENVAISAIDRATNNVITLDTGEIEVGSFISACPDGHILFTGLPKAGSEARVFRMDADGEHVVQLTTRGIARKPECSADSQQVYYSVAENGQNATSLWLISIAGGEPRQVLSPRSTFFYEISRDDKFAVAGEIIPTGLQWNVINLASGQVIWKTAADQSYLESSRVRFSLDNRALIQGALWKGSKALIEIPLDGSARRPVIAPTSARLGDYAWSPSGTQLAVVEGKDSSDVVLITDETGKARR